MTRHPALRTAFEIAFVALLVLTIGGSPARGDLSVATWTGPNNGVWSDPSHWDLGVVPNNGGGSEYEVVVEGGFVVQLDQYAEVASLELTGSGVVIRDDRTLVVTGTGSSCPGVCSLNGALSLEGTGNGAELVVGGVVPFVGTATILWSADPENRVRSPQMSQLLQMGEDSSLQLTSLSGTTGLGTFDSPLSLSARAELRVLQVADLELARTIELLDSTSTVTIQGETTLARLSGTIAGAEPDPGFSALSVDGGRLVIDGGAIDGVQVALDGGVLETTGFAPEIRGSAVESGRVVLDGSFPILEGAVFGGFAAPFGEVELELADGVVVTLTGPDIEFRNVAFLLAGTARWDGGEPIEIQSATVAASARAIGPRLELAVPTEVASGLLEVGAGTTLEFRHLSSDTDDSGLVLSEAVVRAVDGGQIHLATHAYLAESAAVRADGPGSRIRIFNDSLFMASGNLLDSIGSVGGTDGGIVESVAGRLSDIVVVGRLDVTDRLGVCGDVWTSSQVRLEHQTVLRADCAGLVDTEARLSGDGEIVAVSGSPDIRAIGGARLVVPEGGVLRLGGDLVGPTLLSIDDPIHVDGELWSLADQLLLQDLATICGALRARDGGRCASMGRGRSVPERRSVWDAVRAAAGPRGGASSEREAESSGSKGAA